MLRAEYKEAQGSMLPAKEKIRNPKLFVLQYLEAVYLLFNKRISIGYRYEAA